MLLSAVSLLYIPIECPPLVFTSFMQGISVSLSPMYTDISERYTQILGVKVFVHACVVHRKHALFYTEKELSLVGVLHPAHLVKLGRLVLQ